MLSDRRILIFALAVTLFHFANAAMLPLAGQLLSTGKATGASLYMSACIIAAQLVMVPVAAFAGKYAQSWGLRPIFLIGFAVRPIRGVLYTFSHDPVYIVAVQLLDGIGAGIFGVLWVIVVDDLTKGTGRFNVTQGAIATAHGIGAALSNAIAGYIVFAAGYDAGFLFLAAVALIALAIFYFAMPETGKPSSHAIIRFAKREYLLVALLLAAAWFLLLNPDDFSRFYTLIEWETIAALAGLLIAATGIMDSGYLNEAAVKIVSRVKSERQLALLLVAMSVVLSMFLTNDVALFIVVPLTLSLQRLLGRDLSKAIIFEAIAVNAGSALTPIGNPQNLFLWRFSQASFAGFMSEMLVLEAIMLAALFIFVGLSFPTKLLTLEASTKPGQAKTPWPHVIAFASFLVFCNLELAKLGFLILAPLYLWRYRRVMSEVDWPLLVVFMLMFVDLRLASELPAVARLASIAGDPESLFLAAIATSQLVSNVPAAILLAEYSLDWKTIAYGVNLGGNGLLFGSLANLIALRQANDRKIWWTFHLYSIPYLLATSVLAYAFLVGA